MSHGELSINKRIYEPTTNCNNKLQVIDAKHDSTKFFRMFIKHFSYTTVFTNAFKRFAENILVL